MRQHPRSFAALLALGLLGAAALVPLAQTRRGTENGEWRTLGGDIGHTRYSPLDQITPANFETLKEAWKFSPIERRPTSKRSRKPGSSARSTSSVR
jgi:glucose dehydrogenase